jgi:hypothetical protein
MAHGRMLSSAPRRPCAAGVNQAVGAAAFYQQGEVHRRQNSTLQRRIAAQPMAEPQPVRPAAHGGRTDAALAIAVAGGGGSVQRSRLPPSSTFSSRTVTSKRHVAVA